jgi:hypothetical protein
LRLDSPPSRPFLICRAMLPFALLLWLIAFADVVRWQHHDVITLSSAARDRGCGAATCDCAARCARKVLLVGTYLGSECTVHGQACFAHAKTHSTQQKLGRGGQKAQGLRSSGHNRSASGPHARSVSKKAHQARKHGVHARRDRALQNSRNAGNPIFVTFANKD